MGIIEGVKKVFPSRGNSVPVGLDNWQRPPNNTKLNVDKNSIKYCSTKERQPSYVVTDKSQDKYVLYTNSLDTCLGIVLRTEKRGFAGLCHSHEGHVYDFDTNQKTPNRVAQKMAKEVEKKYGKPRRVDLVAGDMLSEDLLRITLESLSNYVAITQENVRLFYGGRGNPEFVKEKPRKTDYAGKVAYNTRTDTIHVGAEPEN